MTKQKKICEISGLMDNPVMPKTATIQVHQAMGLSDESFDEIAKEITEILGGTETVTAAISRLVAVYDARTLLVGMRFMQLLQLNVTLHNAVPKAKRRGTLTPPDNPKLN